MPYKDKEKEREYKAVYYQGHKEKLDALSKQWAKDNSAKFRRIQKRYEATKKGKLAIARKEAKFKGSPGDKCRYRKHHLKRAYGLTLEQYDQMFEVQGGVCAICNGPETNGKRLSVDHDHKTGRIRGLLCHKCNGLLGFACDSADILLNAIYYIEPEE